MPRSDSRSTKKVNTALYAATLVGEADVIADIGWFDVETKHFVALCDEAKTKMHLEWRGGTWYFFAPLMLFHNNGDATLRTTNIRIQLGGESWYSPTVTRKIYPHRTAAVHGVLVRIDPKETPQ